MSLHRPPTIRFLFAGLGEFHDQNRVLPGRQADRHDESDLQYGVVLDLHDEAACQLGGSPCVRKDFERVGR